MGHKKNKENWFLSSVSRNHVVKPISKLLSLKVKVNENPAFDEFTRSKYVLHPDKTKTLPLPALASVKLQQNHYAKHEQPTLGNVSKKDPIKHANVNITKLENIAQQMENAPKSILSTQEGIPTLKKTTNKTNNFEGSEKTTNLKTFNRNKDEYKNNLQKQLNVKNGPNQNMRKPQKKQKINYEPFGTKKPQPPVDLSVSNTTGLNYNKTITNHVDAGLNEAILQQNEGKTEGSDTLKTTTSNFGRLHSKTTSHIRKNGLNKSRSLNNNRKNKDRKPFETNPGGMMKNVHPTSVKRTKNGNIGNTFQKSLKVLNKSTRTESNGKLSYSYYC